MKWKQLHEWNVSEEEAEKIQASLANRAQTLQKPQLNKTTPLVAGAAAAGPAAAVVVMRSDDWQVVEKCRVETAEEKKAEICYERGLMAFSIGPLLLKAFDQVSSEVDIAIFRAHGLAHPRQCGMAAHLGLLLGISTIGCADKLICGEHAPPGQQRGDWTPVEYDGAIVGAALRIQEEAKPLYVSPGFGMDIHEAVQIVLRAAPKHRFPEPLRQARILAKSQESKIDSS